MKKVYSPSRGNNRLVVEVIPSRRLAAQMAIYAKNNYYTIRLKTTDDLAGTNRSSWRYTASVRIKKLKSDIKNIRETNRAKVVTRRRFFVRALNTYVEYELIGGVFTEPGMIAKLSRELQARIVFTQKLPATNERHVSVEIECFGPLSSRELGVEIVNAGVGKYVHVKGDGSIHPNNSEHHPYELVVTAPASQIESVVSKVSEVLNENDCRVNKTCGLHVHLDARYDNANRMFSNLVSAQSILYKMQPLSRRDNTYCKPTPSKSLRTASRGSGRYFGINPQSFGRHRTIEIRLHSGTIDAGKINNFIKILQLIAYNSEEIKRGATSVKGFVKQHKIPAALQSYIESRIAKFGGATDVEESA